MSVSENTVNWVDVPDEFSEWWDSDIQCQGNPFRVHSAAFWAFEGWRARAALAEPVVNQQLTTEPVAWRITDGEGDWEYRTDWPEDWSIQWSARYGRKYEPLYTAPTPTRKPLTAEDLQ